MDRVYQVRPIGVARTPFAEQAEAPIQGAFHPDTRGTIEVLAEYAEGLDDIEGFSHLILIYVLDRCESVTLKPLPFLDDDAHGIFATRNPRRPNHLGLTVVTLHRRDGATLHVGGIDVLDGTPIVDIKPYVPRFDAFPEASEGWFAGREDRTKPPGRE
ncbi:MAG TPA: tRNA (N6-threonylcarbamoyladenosine(37)-N6)-methyltransferase TrmO [Intrasporangiaceae bacterium]|nr:tRNA (N6-threonylcarbamoyladenosine(37)-N6)-methyltransferase TrmO [Intrasporangiaceae bacterium]